MQDIITREQIEHLEAVKVTMETARNRAIVDLQRAIVDAKYAGASYADMGRALTEAREGITEFFAEFSTPVDQRIEALNAEAGISEFLACPALAHEREVRDATVWLERVLIGLRNSNSSAEAAAIEAYRNAFAPKVQVLAEAAE